MIQEREEHSVCNICGNRRHDGNAPNRHESLRFCESVKAFFKIASSYWKTRESIQGWVQFILILLFTATTVVLSKMFNDWYKEFWDNVQNYNIEGFYKGLYWFFFLATIHVCNSTYKSYFISALSMRWRKWLTLQYTTSYLNKNTYYKLQLTEQETDNPDQRIAEDLESFVSLTIVIIVSLLRSIAMIVTFSIILWGLSKRIDNISFAGYTFSLPDGYLFYLVLIYSVFGTVLTFIIGKPLPLLHFRQQRFEADYRYALIRLRENSEAIALYKGEKEEKKRLNEYFSDIVKNYIYIIKRTKLVDFFTLGYAQLAVIFPILISAPLYFTKMITIGSIMQINSAFGQVYDSLSILMNLFPRLATWKSVIDRLALFEKSINKTLQLPKPDIVYYGDGTPLINNLSLFLKPGDRLLIKGVSGIGKSTLLRTIVGIWPYCNGQIKFPKEKKVMFLSQKPYMPIGTLAQVICYPSSVANDNSYLEKMLEKVGLAYLIPNLLRVIVNKPDVVFMDEVTSAIDESNEFYLYEMLKNELPESIIISIGHRTTLEKQHTKILDFSTDVKEVKTLD